MSRSSPRAEPLIRKRKPIASLSPEARAQLNAVINSQRSLRDAATLLGASDATLTILRGAHGTANPKTIERLTQRLREICVDLPAPAT